MSNIKSKKIIMASNCEEGIYCFRLDLISQLKKAGYEVFLVSPRGQYTKQLAAIVSKRIFISINRHGLNPISDLRLFFTYLYIFKREHPDAILTYTIKPNIYASIAAALLHIPYLNNVTGVGNGFQHDNWIKKIIVKMLKIAFRNSACVFFQNRTNKKLFEDLGIIGNKSVLLPGSGVNLQEFPYTPPPNADNGIIFLMLARVCRDKGIAEYIEAARQIRQQYPTAQFHLAGPLEATDMQTIIDNAVHDSTIIYHGNLSHGDAHKLMMNCHCVVMPSYHEGMSNVLLEASATGRPCIASDIPGCMEIVTNGVNGFLCRVKSVEDLRTAMEKILRLDVAIINKMGQMGRQHVECHFSRSLISQYYLAQLFDVFQKSKY